MDLAQSICTAQEPCAWSEAVCIRLMRIHSSRRRPESSKSHNSELSKQKGGCAAFFFLFGRPKIQSTFELSAELDFDTNHGEPSLCGRTCALTRSWWQLSKRQSTASREVADTDCRAFVAVSVRNVHEQRCHPVFGDGPWWHLRLCGGEHAGAPRVHPDRHPRLAHKGGTGGDRIGRPPRLDARCLPRAVRQARLRRAHFVRRLNRAGSSPGEGSLKGGCRGHWGRARGQRAAFAGKMGCSILTMARAGRCRRLCI